MEFIDPNQLIAATSSSELILFQCTSSSITETRRWPPTGDCPMPYSDLAVRQSLEGAEVVTVGEDGLLKRFLLKEPKDHPTQTIETGCDSLTCVSYLGQKEVAVGNLAGKLKIFDLSKGQEVRSCMLRQDDLVGITCVLQHPSQPQLLFCGTEAGSICVWDLRIADQPHPSAFYNCHSVLIPELRFHALSTAHLISVCYDGSALWWNASRLMSPFESVGQLPALGSNRPAGDIKRTQNDTTGWLMPDVMKDRMDIERLVAPSLFCVNSVDTAGDLVAVGGDSEMLQIFSIPV
ncbi:nucleoporin Nup43-like isoform X2 [Varroa jacobsoni]|nr:nucleoporin Nup43-like isoform X2 [Varroa jacobsoni]